MARPMPGQVVFLAAIPFIGLIAASVLFVAAVLVLDNVAWPRAAMTGLALGAIQWAVLSMVFDVLIEREIIGRVGWYLLGY